MPCLILEHHGPFVSATFIRLCDLTLEALPPKVLVAIPDGTIVGCTHVVKDYPLEVVGLVLKDDLIIFYLMEFNILSGRLAVSHYAKIDCQKREVVFEPPTIDKICYEGEPIKIAPLVDTTCRAIKCTWEGITANLLVVIDKVEEPIGHKEYP